MFLNKTAPEDVYKTALVTPQGQYPGTEFL